VRKDQHVRVSTLLSRAETPFIDLSHMGECPTIQLSRVFPKKLNVKDDFDSERFFCAGKSSIRVKSAFLLLSILWWGSYRWCLRLDANDSLCMWLFHTVCSVSRNGWEPWQDILLWHPGPWLKFWDNLLITSLLAPLNNLLGKGRKRTLVQLQCRHRVCCNFV
jgi:hypothetical protein